MPVPAEPRPSREPLEFPADVTPLEPPMLFTAQCDRFGVVLDPDELHKLGLFLAFLLRCNEFVNLTAIKDPVDAWSRHIFDSLTILSVLLESHEPLAFADVGSGGGLPALPLAIARPDDHFTLFESTGKKADFLEAAAVLLHLENVTVVCERAEVAGQDHRSFRESFDVVTAQALGHVRVAAELTVPLAAIGGRVVLTKGEKAEAEIEEAKPALHLLHAGHAGTVETPTGRLVVLEKLRRTPRVYPRRSGEPKRRPLG